MTSPKFKIGDPVYLKTGSKDMVVKENIQSDNGFYVIVTWEQNGEFIEKEFHEDMLEKAP